MYLSAEK